MSLQSLSEDRLSLLRTVRELMDSVSYQIIMSISDYAKPVVEISVQNKIPLSSTYKKIKRLTKHGLVQADKIIIDEAGRKVILYRSKIRGMRIDVVQGNINIKFEDFLHALMPPNEVVLHENEKDHAKKMFTI
jgi:predicted transcriptional regulator